MSENRRIKRTARFRQPLWWLLVLPLILTACLPEGVRVPQSPLLANLERKSGLIAFVGVDGNIYTIDQGGGKLTPITTDAQLPESTDDLLRYYQSPIWSPDSQRLAFVGYSADSIADPQFATIYTSDRAGKGLTETFASFSEMPVHFSWSPDSEHISFLTAAQTRAGFLLQLVPADGGNAQILDIGQPFFWSWAPDSQQMMVHSGGSSPYQSPQRLALLQFDGAIVERGLDLQPASFQNPAWSPDGENLLFAAENAAGQDALILADETGNPLQELTTYDGLIGFNWSPDGEKVAYISTEQANAELIIGRLTVLDTVDAENSIVTEEASIISFFWSPDSRKIAYFVPAMAEVPVGEASQDGSQDTEMERVLILSVLDVRKGSITELATFRPSDLFLNLMPFFDQYLQTATIWSPDSRNVVVSAITPDGINRIWVIAVSGRMEPRTVSDGVLAFWSWE